MKFQYNIHFISNNIYYNISVNYFILKNKKNKKYYFNGIEMLNIISNNVLT